MSRTKKPRKAYRPKYVACNPMATFLGGMSGEHADHLAKLNLRNHAALARLAKGEGDKGDWDLIVGAINIANVMCEQGIGNEGRGLTLAGRDAMLEVGKRFVRTGRIVFKGEELHAVNEAMDWHDTQLENVRAIDVDRAAEEVERRVRNRINTTSVARATRVA